MKIIDFIMPKQNEVKITDGTLRSDIPLFLKEVSAKIMDGFRQKGGRVEIPDCTREDLPPFFVDMGYKVGAEIGVYKGEFTDKLCKAGLKVYAIDPWTAYGDYGETRDDKLQKRQDFLYEHTKRVLAPYDNVTIVRKTSMDAVKDFEDNSLDFVYIDGNHGFKFVAEDIWEWSKKIKTGGVISGHDYFVAIEKPPRDKHTLHVRFVVDAYTLATGIKEWYVLGRTRREEGERCDRWRSWMWIKT